MKNLKRNQIIIFVIALMLVSAGYLSYSANNENRENLVITSSNVLGEEEVASIGDAKLVSSNGIVDLNTETTETGIVSNDTNENNNNNNNNESIENVISTNAKEVDDYFSSSKLTRNTMYSQMLEAYEKILANDSIPSDQKTIAQSEIKNINDLKNKIMICENLIQTKGFEDIVIFVNDQNISVIVKSNKLEQEQIAQIQNIIAREMNAKPENIHISSK